VIFNGLDKSIAILSNYFMGRLRKTPGNFIFVSDTMAEDRTGYLPKKSLVR